MNGNFRRLKAFAMEAAELERQLCCTSKSFLNENVVFTVNYDYQAPVNAKYFF